MENNRFLRQTFTLSPFLTELDTSAMDIPLQNEVISGEIAVTLNGSSLSAWSITPETTSDRNNVLFTLAIGKYKSQNVYHWKALRSVFVLALSSKPGVVVATLYSNESIAKLIVRVEEKHPFCIDYILSISVSLPEPWKQCMSSTLGPLLTLEQGALDIAYHWGRLTRIVDHIAAGLSRKTSKTSPQDNDFEDNTMGRQKTKADPKLPKQVQQAEKRRSRSSPQIAIPLCPGLDEGGSSIGVPGPIISDGFTPNKQTASSPTTGGPSMGPKSRNKQTASKSKATRTVASTEKAPAEVPPSTSLLSQPGLAEEATPPGTYLELVGSLRQSMRNISQDILNACNQEGGEGSVTGVNPTGHPDDIRNVMQLPIPSKPAKVYLILENKWSSNPLVRPLDATLAIPEDLETEIVTLPNLKKQEDRKAELRRRAQINEKFTRDSDYMYIFGRDQIFELALGHMEPSDHRSGRIYRDFEQSGADEIQRELILHNYTKPILTVMPNLDRRPTDWEDCVKAGTFKIINGQHTWHAARDVLMDPVLRAENPRLEIMKTWDVQVVWTDKVSHLHALSFKCNEGHNESKHLTSLTRAIVHCRVLWEQAGKPPLVRKNAINKKKKDKEAIDEAINPIVKAKYEAFRVRACQSLSATVKQEQPDKPIRIDWEKRGERQIIMAPDHVWKKWEEVFKRYESGDLIDLDTLEPIKKSANAKDLTNLAHVTATLLRGLSSVSVENLEEAADHILSSRPRIYLGKGPKKWNRALSLDKWCERRKWKDVIVKAIGDRIAYFHGRKHNNIFLDDNQQIKVEVWRAWKRQKLFSSSIMQAIYFSTGTESFISDTIAVNRKTPQYPPQACLEKIDQALVNNRRTDDVRDGNWSVIVPWKLKDSRFSLQTAAFGVGGKLVNETHRRFKPKKLTSGILDLRHFPLVSKDSEETTSWNNIIKLMEIRALKFGFTSVGTWMIIARKDRRNVVEILRSHFFPNHRCKHVQYTYAAGEPLSKAKTAEVDEITYLELEVTLNNNEKVFHIDEVDDELVFGRQFDKHEYYRAEHKDVIAIDELRMETYIRFLARHTNVGDNVVLAFAGTKPVRACRMMKRNSISFEVMRRSAEKLLFKAVSEGPSMWRTYYLPSPQYMVGEKVSMFDERQIQPLVNYRICSDVGIGGFYSEELTVDLRQSQTSIGNVGTTQESYVSQNPTEGEGQDLNAENEKSASESLEESQEDDDIVSLQSESKDNDIMAEDYSSTESDEEVLEREAGITNKRQNDMSSQSVRVDLGKQPCDIQDEQRSHMMTQSMRTLQKQKRKESALTALCLEKSCRRKEKQMSTDDEEVEDSPKETFSDTESDRDVTEEESVETSKRTQVVVGGKAPRVECDQDEQAKEETPVTNTMDMAEVEGHGTQREEQNVEVLGQKFDMEIMVVEDTKDISIEEVIQISEQPKEVGTTHENVSKVMERNDTDGGAFDVQEEQNAMPLNSVIHHSNKGTGDIPEKNDIESIDINPSPQNAIVDQDKLEKIRIPKAMEEMQQNFETGDQNTLVATNAQELLTDRLGRNVPTGVKVARQLKSATLILQQPQEVVEVEERVVMDKTHTQYPGSKTVDLRDMVLETQEHLLTRPEKESVSVVDVARQADRAWKLQEMRNAELKKQEAALQLAHDIEEFQKKFSKPAPDRVLLLDDDEYDDEDEKRRTRLLNKFNCVVPVKGTMAVNMFGSPHIPGNMSQIIKPERIDADTTHAMASHSGEPSHAGLQLFQPSLTLPTVDIKEELLLQRWTRKRKAERDEEIEEEVEVRVQKRISDLTKGILHTVYSDLEAAGINLPNIAQDLPSAAFRSELQSGVSHGSPIIGVPPTAADPVTDFPSVHPTVDVSNIPNPVDTAKDDYPN